MKIGVFDSGVGGLTVLAALRSAMPEADFVYLGDTANVPYGGKSAAQVAQLSACCAETLVRRGVDRIVIACNTASSLGREAVRLVAGPIPVDGVLEAGALACLRALKACEVNQDGSRAPTALVLATRATVRSHAYRDLISEWVLPERIVEQECPLLAPLIEEGWINGHPVLQATLDQYLANYAQTAAPGVALLACTHYPWIARDIAAALPGWTIVDSAQAVAEWVKAQALAPVAGGADQPIAGKIEWIFTDPDSVPAFARKIMQQLDGGAVSEPIAARDASHRPSPAQSPSGNESNSSNRAPSTDPATGATNRTG